MIFLAVFALLLVQGVCATNPAHGGPPAVRIAIPIDADSPGTWSEAINGAPSVGIIILNPSNGPGQGASSNYAQLVGKAQARGIGVLGYVFTEWADGKVSIQDAEVMIDHYYSWYHVDGIMLDEANDSCDAAPLHFYSTLYSYIKSKPGPGTVMLNPGKATGECYAAISDMLLTFESDYARYLGAYVGANWTEKYPPSHFFHIVFDAPTVAEMQNCVSLAATRGAGWVYVTDVNNSRGNPYSSLPSYFGQELDYLGQPSNPVPPPSSAAVPVIQMPVMLILGLTAAGSVLVVVARRKNGTD